MAALSYAGALGAWEKLKAARANGRCPATEHRRLRVEERAHTAQLRKNAAGGGQGYTVERLAEDYRLSVNRTEKGKRELQKLFERRLGPIASLTPDQVTRSVAFDVISGLRDTPVEASNLRRELGAAWDWGHDAGRIADDVPNWWRLVLRGKLPSKGKIVNGEHVGVVKRFLSLAEVGQVLRHLPHLPKLPAQLLTLYLWTGCRGAEICGMRGDEVSEEEDGWWWTIPKARLKGRRHALVTDLRVPLIGRALDIVRAQIDVHGEAWLFPRRPHAGAGPTDQKTVGVAVWYHMPRCERRPEVARARWPVDSWAPHDLRRTVRTQLAAMGCPNEIGEAILGHLQPGIVGIYNRHRYDAERREWLVKLDRVWELVAAR